MKAKEKEIEEAIILDKIMEPKKRMVYYDALMNRNLNSVVAGVNEINEKLQNMEHFAELKLPDIPSSGIQGFLQKVIKKGLDWYMEPILQQQTRYNQELLPAIGRLTELAMSDNMAIDQLISNQETTKGVQHCNLKIAREKVIEYTLFQMGIETSDCLDLRQLPEEVLKGIAKDSLIDSRAILLEKDKRLMLTDLAEAFVEYAVIDKTMIFLAADLVGEEE